MPGPFDFTPADIDKVLAGQPPYRARQVWAALHAGRLPEEMTDLPKGLRSSLGDVLRPALTLEAELQSDGGDTVKWVWTVSGGMAIETVLMHYPDRTTVCLSSQAGCAMACSFCATGQAGFGRHLTAGEMVEQVVRARRAALPRRLGNVVFMGMGEPLANYDAVLTAVRRLHDDLGISARHLTVSTVGVVPGIHRLASEPLPVNLAVSLHAANDELRNELVPLNRRYPLARVLDACAGYVAAKGRRLSFEWALIDGVNDRVTDAAELAVAARPLGAHVNLIPLNPTAGYGARGTPGPAVRRFRDLLRSLGVNATVRRNRGTDIDAACGQLAGRVAAVGGADTPVEISARAR